MNTSPIDKLLPRLDQVKQIGPGRWIARSPAFPDQKTGSWHIRVLEDGRIICHDFAGAETAHNLALIGLTFSDLFPDSLPKTSSGARRDWRHAHAARDALRLIAKEARLVALAAESMAEGAFLDKADRDRLMLASSRITAAAEAV